MYIERFKITLKPVTTEEDDKMFLISLEGQNTVLNIIM